MDLQYYCESVLVWHRMVARIRWARSKWERSNWISIRINGIWCDEDERRRRRWVLFSFFFFTVFLKTRRHAAQIAKKWFLHLPCLFSYFVHMYFPFDSILFNSAHNTSARAHMPYTHSIWEMESKRTERTIITANDTRRRRRLRWIERDRERKREKKLTGKVSCALFIRRSFGLLCLVSFVTMNAKCVINGTMQLGIWSATIMITASSENGVRRVCELRERLCLCMCASQTKGSINWNVSIHFRFLLLLLPLLLLMLFLSVPLCTGAVLAIKPIEKSVTPLVTTMKFICGQWRRINLLNRPLNWPINDFYAIQLIYYIFYNSIFFRPSASVT